VSSHAAKAWCVALVLAAVLAPAPAARADDRIPLCAAGQPRDGLFQLGFDRQGLAQETFSGDDVVSVVWSRGAARLHGVAGMLIDGWNTHDARRGLVDVVERVRRPPGHRFEDEQVLDLRGRRPGGRRFRFLGTPLEYYRYDDLAPADAAFFDRVLDSVCFVVPR
jgi:hypothetical protein